MRKTLCVAVLVVGFLMAAMPVSAGVYVFEPDPFDLDGLGNLPVFEWGLDLGTGWYFEEVVLTLKNVRNNVVGQDNVLWIHMLDNVEAGTKIVAWESSTNTTDYFACEGVLIDNWVDNVYTGTDLTYTFSSMGILDDWTTYVNNDGLAGIGFDADCHFLNDGIELTVTGAVPEPGTMMLFALGMVSGVAAYRKKKK